MSEVRGLLFTLAVAVGLGLAGCGKDLPTGSCCHQDADCQSNHCACGNASCGGTCQADERFPNEIDVCTSSCRMCRDNQD